MKSKMSIILKREIWRMSGMNELKLDERILNNIKTGTIKKEKAFLHKRMSESEKVKTLYRMIKEEVSKGKKDN